MIAGMLVLLSLVLIVAGVVNLLRGQLLVGVGLIVLGLLVGPGGVSIWHPSY